MVELNYLKICRSIEFPVFPISNEDVYMEDGLLFSNGLVLDDKNQPGNTLGKRRLTTPHEKAKIGKAVIDFIDLVNCKESTFIDNAGVCFYYEKTKFCDIVSYKISKKISMDTHTVIFLKGVNSPYSINYYPYGKDWAQVLLVGRLPWKLFSLSENKLETFKRKI